MRRKQATMEQQPPPAPSEEAVAQASAAPAEGAQAPTAEEVQAPTTTRSGRVTRPPNWHKEYQSHMQTQAHPNSMTMEYTPTDARVIAMLFQYLEEKSYKSSNEITQQFIQT